MILQVMRKIIHIAKNQKYYTYDGYSYIYTNFLTLMICTRQKFEKYEKYLNRPAEFQKQWNISTRQLKPRPFWFKF